MQWIPAPNLSPSDLERSAGPPNERVRLPILSLLFSITPAPNRGSHLSLGWVWPQGLFSWEFQTQINSIPQESRTYPAFLWVPLGL